MESVPRLPGWSGGRAAAPGGVVGTASKHRRGWLRRREAGVAAMLVAFVIVVALVEPRLLAPAPLKILAAALPLLLVGALGQLVVMLARHVDLSMGSTLGLAAIVAGMLMREHPQWPLAAGFAVAIGCGALLGLFNGLLVALFELPAIIVTLGTLSLYRGMVFIVSGSRQIDPHQIPVALIRLAQDGWLGLPWIVWIALGTALAVHLLLAHSRAGREIHALGSNPRAALLRGLPVRALTMLVFVLSGALAGLAGILYAARFGYVNPAITGVGFEFTVIAAVVIGGTSIRGGIGSVAGVLLGVLFIAAVQVALPVLGVSGYAQSAMYGAVIIVALIIDHAAQRAARSGGEGAR